MNGWKTRLKNSQENVLFVEAVKFTEVTTTSALLKKAGIKSAGLIEFKFFREDVMKIAIESNDGGKTISNPFVRSNGFLIYEVDEKNVFIKEFRTSERLKTAILENELDDCCAVISRGMPSAFKQELEKRGKKVLITFSTSPRKALSVFLTNQYSSKIPHLHS